MTEVIVYSGWFGGVMVGLYMLAQFLISGKALGVSTGLGNVCGFVSKQSFFHSGPYATLNNWRLWFLVGIPLGGLIAALTSPGPLVASFSLGALYDSVLPQAIWAKGALLFAGGTVMGLGARMAGGCTSGHAITGISLWNWPSAVAGPASSSAGS